LKVDVKEESADWVPLVTRTGLHRSLSKHAHHGASISPDGVPRVVERLRS
jgi:hypothetical protein